ncbi:MAG: chloramphenicol acetyltransferase [Anaerolineae bacterium]|nr:chloramphenicol acetyltransferase [Anaerolineae bacterium]
MRYLDLENWPRRQHFAIFNAFDYPHFNLTANVDVTMLLASAKQAQISFTVAAVHSLARAANEIEEFRYRIRGSKVIVHETVHPSFTMLNHDELFSFCTVEYAPEFGEFQARAIERIAAVKQNLILEDEPGQDDLLFMTGIPWVSFTSMMHPIHMSPVDSVPRIAWGKFFEERGRKKMPVSVQVHHALMDGLHMGRYFMRLQELLDDTADLF